MKIQKLIYTAMLSLFIWAAEAQNVLEYEVKAGFNIGGTSPLPLPVEIREINGYNPLWVPAIEGNITKWFNSTWGTTIGLRLENKGMTTKATVKNYGMEIIGDGGEKVSGNWTGDVKTKVRNTYLSLPVLAAYHLNDSWTLRVGPYFSYLLDGNFSGHVYDGYLRQGDPTGPKVEFKDGKTATYDFSNELRNFSWGGQAGTSWRTNNHLSLHADLCWGFNDIFKSTFKTVTFNMYPIYLNIGAGYIF